MRLQAAKSSEEFNYMTIAATLITALIAGGIAFLLGWVVCKAVLTQTTTATGNNDADKAAEESTTDTPELPLEISELQTTVQQLHHDKAEVAAKNSRYEDRINEQVQQLAHLQEDRDRIRVEHGSQKRMINTLQQTHLEKDKVRQKVLKDIVGYEKQIAELRSELEFLSAKKNPSAPVPSMATEGSMADLRDQLHSSRAAEASMKKQLQALQEWAKPLATENTQQGEVIDRLKHQIRALRNEQQQTEAKLNRLSDAIKKARVVKQERIAAEATSRHLALTETASDHVAPQLHSDNQNSDQLEETHTDMQVAKNDLKKIRGIGPGLERRLNDAGVFNYAQLAELGEAELKNIAARTKKAHRANWANEARQLMSQAAAN